MRSQAENPNGRHSPQDVRDRQREARMEDVNASTRPGDTTLRDVQCQTRR